MSECVECARLREELRQAREVVEFLKLEMYGPEPLKAMSVGGDDVERDV